MRIKNGMKALNSSYPLGWTEIHLLSGENNFRRLGGVVDAALKKTSWDEILWNARYSQSPLHLAAKASHPTSVDVLLNKGHPVDVQDEYGNTPLHVAIENGNFTAASMLINAGADVNAQNDMKWTPLHLAVRINHPEFIRYLRKKGANPNIVEDNDFMDVPSIWEIARTDASYNALEAN